MYSFEDFLRIQNSEIRTWIFDSLEGISFRKFRNLEISRPEIFDVLKPPNFSSIQNQVIIMKLNHKETPVLVSGEFYKWGDYPTQLLHSSE